MTGLGDEKALRFVVSFLSRLIMPSDNAAKDTDTFFEILLYKFINLSMYPSKNKLVNINILGSSPN